MPYTLSPSPLCKPRGGNRERARPQADAVIAAIGGGWEHRAGAAGTGVQLLPGCQGRLEHRRQLLEGRATGRVGAHARLHSVCRQGW